MPYIPSKKLRKQLDEVFYSFVGCGDTDNHTGKLNYLLFKLAKHYGRNYKSYRDFLGELESAKLEIYRRLVAPHEDEAIKRNGDVK
jgi:hypothetical protein